MIRLFIIEDHPVIVSGLTSLFRKEEEGISISQSAINVAEALKHANPETFDLILLDLWIPNSNPVDNVKQLRRHFPDKPIVIYTSEETAVWHRKMLHTGVKAYIIKTADITEIRSTLGLVASGKTVINGRVFPEEALSEYLSMLEGKFILSPLQLEMVYLLSKGHTQSEISDKTNSSLSKVEKMLRQIRESCGAKTNAELVRILMERREI